jgi:hypothetical protein
MHGYATQAFGVFEEWPDRFYPFVEWVREKSNIYGAVSLLEEMGPLYVLLYEGYREVGLDAVRSVAEDYISRNWSDVSEGCEDRLTSQPRLLSRRTGFPEDRASIGGMVCRPISW